MCTSREVITLQFGHYANFVCTHWWNLHEEQFSNLPYEKNENEIDYDVLYREGQNDKRQVTFTPRTLLVDLKGSLKTLPEIGDLYDNPVDFETEQPTASTWKEDSLEVKKEQKAPKNEFLNAFKRTQDYKFNISDTEVNVWSDFLHGRFHPRSVNVIKDYNYENSHLFNHFEAGTELFKSEFFEDDFCDKLRLYTEECDLMQGFNIFNDGNNGFGGLAASCTEYLVDEFNKTPVTIYPVFPNSNDEDVEVDALSEFTINTVLLYDSLAANGALVVPLSTNTEILGRNARKLRNFKFLDYKNSFYHTSSILASAIDLFTLAYRKKGAHLRMGDVVADLTIHDKKFASGSLLMPLNYHKAQVFSDFLEIDKEPLVCLSPDCEIDYNGSCQFFGLRGFSDSVFKNDPYLSKGDSFMYMNKQHQSCYNNVSYVKRGLPVSGTFPKIIDQYKDDKETNQSPTSADLPAVKAIAGLHSNNKVGEMLLKLLDEDKRLRLAGRYISKRGIELDNYKESIERLKELESRYTLKRFYDE